ncbi:O-antigen ligase family protein [Deinococcus sp. UYEF24]
MMQIFLNFLGIVILSYAVLGKNAAYIHLGPLYIGEILLIFGIIAYFFNVKRLLWFKITPSIAYIIFFVVQAAQTIPYISTYGIDSIRDAALWYYALFTIIVFIAMQSRGGVRKLANYMDRVATYFIVVAPIVLLFNNLSFIPYPLKPGDILVFLGICFLWITYVRNRPTPFILLWALFGLLEIGITNRAGFVAVIITTIPYTFNALKNRVVWISTPIILSLIAIFIISGITIQITSNRSLDSNQVISNILSIFGSSGDSVLDSTKEWRINWWNAIAADSGPSGVYALTGKGYGINLAQEYGYVTENSATLLLRAPHSVWFDYLARAGVPGILSVILLIFTSFVYSFRRLAGILSIYRKIIIWSAFCVIGILVNGSLDVYIENPIGGIPLWSMLGIMLGTTYYANKLSHEYTDDTQHQI